MWVTICVSLSYQILHLRRTKTKWKYFLTHHFRWICCCCFYFFPFHFNRNLRGCICVCLKLILELRSLWIRPPCWHNKIYIWKSLRKQFIFSFFLLLLAHNIQIQWKYFKNIRPTGPLDIAHWHFSLCTDLLLLNNWQLVSHFGTLII